MQNKASRKALRILPKKKWMNRDLYFDQKIDRQLVRRRAQPKKYKVK